jgi:hypothetical protein
MNEQEKYLHALFVNSGNLSTVNRISDYILSTLYRSYFKDISVNVELQVYSVAILLTFYLILTFAPGGEKIFRGSSEAPIARD